MITKEYARKILDNLTYQNFSDTVSDKIVNASMQGNNIIFVDVPNKFTEQFVKDLDDGDFEFIPDTDIDDYTGFTILW